MRLGGALHHKVGAHQVDAQQQRPRLAEVVGAEAERLRERGGALVGGARVQYLGVWGWVGRVSGGKLVVT